MLSVDRVGTGCQSIPAANLHRIHVELGRELIQGPLEGKSRLYRSMPSLWPTAGLVGVHPLTLEAVGRKIHGPCQQLSRVVRRNHPEGVVCPAINQNL